MNNLFSDIPADLSDEVFQTLLSHEQLKIERIVSKGHTSPPQGWYDQDEHEWVLVLQGAGELTFEDGRVERLSAGDHLNIPAHCKHKVSWTDPEQETIWLAIFYR
ncbi:cupin domain-containing protein [Pseudoalteromonas sp. DL2-H2.2]|uniref:cupin domain-containing protein n=1 Tax=Pseudoalteromonas sp. DL2-H2.2 TaxID=2908889 RepID=UPI001F34715E|nr:cupin domain-containing protein [Pseudoalteromonas sp. DL2-H2.2]MCF2907204.1 cupin domain-containing protein [Pseudoalteromonas sp. DL2-H2.2]